MIYSIRTPGAEDVVMNVTVTNQYMLEINGLYPLTEYTFKVAAIINHEIGPYNIDYIQTSSPESKIL